MAGCRFVAGKHPFGVRRMFCVSGAEKLSGGDPFYRKTPEQPLKQKIETGLGCCSRGGLRYSRKTCAVQRLKLAAGIALLPLRPALSVPCGPAY